MERKKSSRSEALPAVVLYLDDVEEIIRIFLVSGGSVTIADDDYTYDSLDELIARRGKHPRTLQLRRAAFGVSVSIQRFDAVGVHITAWGDESDEIVYFKLKELLGRRRRFFARVMVPVVWFSITVLAMALAFAQQRRWIPGSHANPLAWIFVVGFILGCLSMFVRSGFGSTINLSRRHEATSFWSRNAEKLIIGLFGALLGAFGKAVSDWIVAHLRSGSP